MSYARRQFLRAGFSLGALLTLRGADLPQIRANVQRPEFRQFWTFMTTVDFAAEEKFLNHELRFANDSIHIARTQVTMMRSAFVHVVAPDTRHLALARTALGKLLQYPRWD